MRRKKMTAAPPWFPSPTQRICEMVVAVSIAAAIVGTMAFAFEWWQDRRACAHMNDDDGA